MKLEYAFKFSFPRFDLHDNCLSITLCRYKVYFYGTYETGTLKAEDMWPYNPETKAKFAQKNMKKKGYTEGIDQIENTPEIAAVEGEEEVVVKKVEKPAVVEKVETPKSTKRKAAEMEANVTPARY